MAVHDREPELGHSPRIHALFPVPPAFGLKTPPSPPSRGPEWVLAASPPCKAQGPAEASPGAGDRQGGQRPPSPRRALEGLPGVLPPVLVVHPLQVPGAGEEVRVGAVGSVVGCGDRARGSAGPQDPKGYVPPRPRSPRWWVSSRRFMISAKSCGATRLRASRRVGRSARLESSLSRGEPGGGLGLG